MKYIELSEKGLLYLDVNKNRTQMDWYYVDRIDEKSSNESWGASWRTDDSDNHLSLSAGASIASAKMIGNKAPLWPRGLISSEDRGPKLLSAESRSNAYY